MKWLPPFFILIFLTLGCICSQESGLNADTEGGILGSLGKAVDSVSDGGGELPEYCSPPKESLTLTLSDCDKIGNSLKKYSCITGYAIVKKDVQACNNIKTKEIRGGCVSVIAECSKDESLCKVLADDMASMYTCIGGVAEIKGDVNLCKGIDNPVFRNLCIIRVAGANGEISLCEMIDDKSSLDKCVKAVAKKTLDARLCEKISGNIDTWRQECIMEVSMMKSDITLCGGLKTDTRAGKDKMIKCLENISSTILSASECNSVKDESIRDYNCLTPLALKKEEPKICMEIKDESRLISCITKVAVEKGDAQVCTAYELPKNSMRGSYGKNDCIIAVAEKTGEKSVCGLIIDNKNAKIQCEKIR